MTYIENIFLCLALPLILSLFFMKGRVRCYALFLTVGMAVCLLSAYVNSFFMGQYGVDGTVAAIEITPVCEEVMKLLPLLFFYLIFEPEPKEMPAAAIAIAVGFATFENVCYLTENGAANFNFLLIRGISAGALHLLCGVLSGFGVSYVFRRRWLAATALWAFSAPASASTPSIICSSQRTVCGKRRDTSFRRCSSSAYTQQSSCCQEGTFPLNKYRFRAQSRPKFGAAQFF